MANFNQTIADIDENIVPDNHARSITGAKLNSVLKEIVNDVNDKKQDIIDDLSQIRTNAETAYHKPQNGIPADDLEQGVIPDVSQFITKSVNDLVNYYKKQETYNKTEVDTIINAIKQFEYVVASALPTADASTMGKVYLVPSADPDTRNIKDEYVTIFEGGTYKWEQIGSTAIDLSGYVTTQALNSALSNYTTTAILTSLLAGKMDKVVGAPAGNIAVLDSAGNVTDSGKKPSDFADATQFATLKTQVESIIGVDANFKGIFATSAELPVVTTAAWAMVGNDLTALDAYVITEGGSWAKFGSATYDFSGKQVTISQNTQTGGYDIAVGGGTPTNVAGQSDLKDLDGQINGSTTQEERIIPETDFTADRYYNLTDAIVGEAYTESGGTSSDTYRIKIQVSEGEIYKIYGKGKSAANGIYALLGEGGIVLAKEGNVNYRTTPKTIEVTEDGLLYVNLTSYDAATDKVVFVTTTQVKGLDEKVSEIEDTISDIEEELIYNEHTDYTSLFAVTDKKVYAIPDVGNAYSEAEYAGMKGVVFTDVREGDIFHITGRGGNTYRLYAKALDGIIIARSPSESATEVQSYDLTCDGTWNELVVNVVQRYEYSVSKDRANTISATIAEVSQKVKGLDTEVTYLKGENLHRCIEFVQGNKLIHANKRNPFSWGSFTPAVLAIKSDDLTHDVDLVAKIMADNNLPLHLAAPVEYINLPVDGITDEGEKIGDTRLDVVRYVISHGGEIMEHSINTFTSPDYYDPNGIFPIFIEQQKKWAELGINVRGAWVANDFPTAECKSALEPYLYYYYEYSNGYADDAPYSAVSKINDGSASSPTTAQEFIDWIDTLIAQHKFGTLTIHGFTRITQSVFEEVLAYVQQKVTDGDLLVKTWGEVYDGVLSSM